MLTPHTSAAFNRSGMLCADGRCKTLDSAADGYTRGEACASIVLQLETTLPAHTDPSALCIVRGSAVNQDGKSSTLTAPNGPAQQATVRLALATCGADPSSLAALRMHGTGTPLGDPIEVGALSAVLAKRSAATGTRMVLAAGKSSVGHTEPAAGVVGVVQAVHAAFGRSGQPILHLRQVWYMTFIILLSTLIAGLGSFPLTRT